MNTSPVELFCRSCGDEGFYERYTSYPKCVKCQKKK